MIRQCVVASDIGSGGCKTIVMQTGGAVLAAAQQEYRTTYPHPGWVEQNPDDWYAAFCSTVRSALDQAGIAPSAVVGVGIGGVTHNAVLLGADDRPLAPTILMFDTRSSEQVNQILGRWGADEVRRQTLNDVATVWTWPQLAWVREQQPAIWKRIRRILFPKDYVRHLLAPSPVTDVIDASGTLLYNPRTEAWIPEFCGDLGLDPDWLPQAVHATDLVARVSARGAADTGLAAGTPVITGTTDTVAEVLGSGGIRPGSAIVKLASVGRLAVVTTEPLMCPHIMNYRHVLDGLWYPGSASKYAASAYRWLRELAWTDRRGRTIYRLMDDAAGRVTPGCDGLLFHPHLMGEWAPHWNDRMRGDFLGLTARHKRGHMTRAVLEGVAFALRDALDELQGAGLHADDLRLIGQGSRSKLWAQIVADVLNRPLRIPEQPDAAYGVGLLVATGIGALPKTVEALDEVLVYRSEMAPNPETAARYTEMFGIYRASDAALGDINERLHRFEHNQPVPILEPA
jgi:xylulokinase